MRGVSVGKAAMKSLIASACMFLLLASGPVPAAQFKVLVVMSYEEDSPCVHEIREGIDGVMQASS